MFFLINFLFQLEKNNSRDLYVRPCNTFFPIKPNFPKQSKLNIDFKNIFISSSLLFLNDLSETTAEFKMNEFYGFWYDFFVYLNFVSV